MKGIVEIAKKTLKTKEDIRLIILDPLTEFLGNTDSHKNAEVRRALIPLISFASEHSVKKEVDICNLLECPKI